MFQACSCSLVASCIHDLVIHAVVSAVRTLTPESLVRAPLERRQHLLVVRPKVSVVLKMILEHWLLHGRRTLVGHLGVLGVPGVVPQVLGFHFVFYQLGVSGHVADDLLAWLTEASVDLQFLVADARSIRLLLQSLAGTHLLVLVIARVVGSVALEPRVASGSRAVLTSSQARLQSPWVSIHWVLTSTRRACLRPPELSRTKLPCLAVVLVNCNLLVSLLVFQSLSNEWFIVLSDYAAVDIRLHLGLSQLVELLVAGEARLHTAVWVLTGISGVVALLVEVCLGIW